MPPRRRGSSGFRGVRERPNDTYYAEIHVGGFRQTLGTYATPEQAARAYDAVAWRFRRPRSELNFPDCPNIVEAEFLAPRPTLLTNEDRDRHRQVQRRIATAEHDEELMRRWREEFPGDVADEEAFFRNRREQRRADRRRRREAAQRESEEHWDTDDDRWSDFFYNTSSDDE